MSQEVTKGHITEQPPLFSVIVPTYNRSKWLMCALESIFSQTCRDFEVIVVDDGSVDDTGERMRSLTHPVKYIFQENQGVSAARNRGGIQASGKWLAFLDSDDEWLPGYLEEQRKNILLHPACKLHMMNSCQFRNTGDKVDSFADSSAASMLKKEVYIPENHFQFILENSLFFLQPTVISRELFQNLGGFNEKLIVGEDFELIARVSAHSPVAFYSRISVNIIRRQELQPSLSVTYFSDEISTGANVERVFESLLASSQCCRHTRIIRLACGSIRRAMGNVHLKNGRRGPALRLYYRAWKADRTWRSLVRMLMIVFPVKLARKTIRVSI